MSSDSENEAAAGPGDPSQDSNGDGSAPPAGAADDVAGKFADDFSEAMSSELLAALDIAPGVLLSGRYVLGVEIGSGAHGAVHEAIDQKLGHGKKVAIKILHKPILDEAMAGEAMEEAALLASLDHESIVSVTDHGMTDGRQPFLVTELVQGLPLDRFAREGKLHTREVVDLIAYAADALDHAHNRGVLHRDVKPANLLGFRDDHGRGALRIIDFGIAVVVAPGVGERTDGTSSTGTPDFMSPEQRSGKALAASSDVYSLGAVLYHLLVGSPPLDEHAGMVGVPHGLAGVLRNALATDPEVRFQTAGEFAADLRAWRAHFPTSVLGPAPLLRGALVFRRNLARLAAIMLILSAMGLVQSRLDLDDSRAQGETVRMLRSARSSLADSYASLAANRGGYGTAWLSFALGRVSKGPSLPSDVEDRFRSVRDSLAPVDGYEARALREAAWIGEALLHLAKDADSLRRFLDESDTAVSGVVSEGAMECFREFAANGSLKPVIEASALDSAEAFARGFLHLRESFSDDSSRRQRALECFERCIVSESLLRPFALVGYAIAAGDGGEAPLAFSVAEELMADENPSPHLLNLAGMLLLVPEPQRSAEIYRQLCELEPGESAPRINLGLALEQLGHDQQALIEFERAVAVDPTARTRCYLGERYLKLGRASDATEEARRAVAANENNDWALALLGRSLIAEGKIKEGIAALEKAPTVNKTPHSATFISLAQGRAATGREDLAIEALKRGLEILGDHQNLLYNLGNSQRRVGDFEGAIESYQRSIAVHPQRSARINLAIAFGMKGDHEASAKTLEVLARDYPEDPDILINLASALMDINKPRLALEHLERAKELGGEDPYNAQNRVMAHIMLKDLVTASSVLEKARIDFPDFKHFDALDPYFEER